MAHMDEGFFRDLGCTTPEVLISSVQCFRAFKAVVCEGSIVQVGAFKNLRCRV